MSKFWLTSTGCCLAVFVILLAGCGDDSPTKAPNPGSLFFSEVTVGIVPQGSEEVDLVSTDAGGAPSPCQVSSSDPSVASVTLVDGTLRITGLSVGTTNLTVTNGAGGRRVLPVQVYDPMVLDTGELLIAYTTQFEYLYAWNDVAVTFWKPIPPPGFQALGTYSQNERPNPNGIVPVICVKAKPGSNAIALSTGFDSYYSQIHTPIAPPGYKVLGDVFTRVGEAPEPVACIREDLTVSAQPFIFWLDYHGVGGGLVSMWEIVPKNDGFHESAHLAPRMSIFWFGEGSPPLNHPVLNVLKVDLPMLAQAETQEFFPRLLSYENPPPETVPRRSWAMLMPYSMVRDTVPGHDFEWQIGNSPFYRLERESYYKRLYHYYNVTTEPQPCQWRRSWGITTEASRRLWNETQISLSVEAGLSFKGVSGEITATVSERFGYETQTSVSQLQADETVTAVTVPPNKAAALWQQYDRYRLYCHSGLGLQEVKSWEVGAVSFVVDQYPDQ